MTRQCQARRTFAPAPAAEPLRAWSGAQLREIAEQVRPAWREWLSSWSTGADAAEDTVTTSRADESGASTREWLGLGERDGGMAWLAGGEEQAQRLVHGLLFGELPTRNGEAGAIAAQVRSEASGELLAALRAALGISPQATQSPPGDSSWHRWSGAIELVLACKDAQLHLLLDGACVAAICGHSQAAKPPQAANLDPVAGAIQSRTITLSAVLQPFELDLGSLTQLRPGDVLPLEHSLDAELMLVDRDGGNVFGGFLGRAGHRRALQLTAAS